MESSSCTHHWLLEATEASGASGRCKKCGAEKLHTGGVREFSWGDYHKNREMTNPRSPVDSLADQIVSLHTGRPW